MIAFRVVGCLGSLALVACASRGQALPAASKPADTQHFEAQTARVEVAAPEASTVPAAPVASPAQQAEAPTWSAIYARYLARGTEGGCARSGACHAVVMADAPGAYSWLAQRGYIAGTESALVSKSNSCLRWFGGNMPPRGAANEEAARDLEAWAAAGAANN